MKNNLSSSETKVILRYREPYFLVGNMLLCIDHFFGKSFITKKSFEEKFLEDLPKGTPLEITPEAEIEIERLIQENLKI